MMSYLIKVFIGSLSVFLPLLVIQIVRIVQSKRKFVPISRTYLFITSIFCFYIAGVLAVTGIPAIGNFNMDIHVNFIPFQGLIPNMKQYILNVVLFIPFGFLLPLIWRSFRKLIPVAVSGFAFSLFIEALQLLNFRATDIDDLCTNTLGAILGYGIFLLGKKAFLGKSFSCERKSLFEETREFTVYVLIAFGTMVLIDPFVSNVIWSFLYY